MIIYLYIIYIKILLTYKIIYIYINIKYILNLSDWRDLNPHTSTPNIDTLPITQQSVYLYRD